MGRAALSRTDVQRFAKRQTNNPRPATRRKAARLLKRAQAAAPR